MRTRLNSRNRLLLAICVLCIGICDIGYTEGRYIYDSRGKRDPFVPLVGVTAKTVESLEDIMSIEDVNLQGVAHDSTGKKIAILNGEILKEGETVGRLTVKKISKSSITLTIDEEEYNLNIYEEEGG